ncbi:hypothetical protein KP509_22G022900 [Ceratopteris richardii]|nr:hypothetical protein KP509_22G022900 [Ceratopteris richardii]
MNENKVTLKASNVEPTELFESVKRKSKGKVTKLLYPAANEKKLGEVRVVLKMNIDCSKCKNKILKAAWKIEDVRSVEVAGQTVVITGWNLDPREVCSDVSKYSGKLAEIVPETKDSHEEDNTNKDDEMEENDDAMEQDYQPPQIYMYACRPYFSDENPNPNYTDASPHFGHKNSDAFIVIVLIFICMLILLIFAMRNQWPIFLCIFLLILAMGIQLLA